MKLFQTICLCLLFFPFSQQAQTSNAPQINQTMIVEIWSDVCCPYCYIGKRKFEAALAQFSGKDSVRVIWRSFLLDPNLKTDAQKPLAQSLSDSKGWSLEQTKAIMDTVSIMALNEGLEYHFDKAVVANTFDAHRFSHLAALHGKQAEAEEKLFAAYFTEGKNIADHEVLAAIGTSLGIAADETKKMLSSKALSEEVQADLNLAQEFEISSVPFFVFDRRIAVSGAQNSNVFLQALQKMMEKE